MKVINCTMCFLCQSENYFFPRSGKLIVEYYFIIYEFHCLHVLEVINCTMCFYANLKIIFFPDLANLLLNIILLSINFIAYMY